MSAWWFFDDMLRVASERRSVEDLAAEATWLRDPTWTLTCDGLTLSATIAVHDQLFPIRMVYPACFPALPPTVRPQEPDARWSGHQYGDGTLCLEWGPDTWRPELTGRAMLESAYSLLSIEKNPSSVKPQTALSRHELTSGQSIRGSKFRSFLSLTVVERLRRHNANNGWVEFSIHKQTDSFLLLIQRIIDSTQDEWSNDSVPKSFYRPRDPRGASRALLLHLPVDGIEKVSNVEELDSLLSANGQRPPDAFTRASERFGIRSS